MDILAAADVAIENVTTLDTSIIVGFRSTPVPSVISPVGTAPPADAWNQKSAVLEIIAILAPSGVVTFLLPAPLYTRLYIDVLGNRA